MATTFEFPDEADARESKAGGRVIETETEIEMEGERVRESEGAR